ncbi:MAG: glucose 1-dehydrogenase [Spirochaetales bacterium]|nr:glucose 1-dehydrogenase [Spirochaetales bacterium]
MRLKDKVALITGASKGIGRGIALGMAKEGADVIVNYFSDEEGARQAAKEIEKMGRRVLLCRADISISSEVDMMVETAIKEFGKIDILINNAGIAIWKPFFEVSESVWDRTLNVNLKGAFLCSQAVARTMVKNGGGNIVNISSNGGYAALDCLVPYCASKGGMTLLTKAMSTELAPYKIRVNAVGPGPIEIERNLREDPKFQDTWPPYIPLKRVGLVEEVVMPVIFLVSDEASYITGQTLYVEGGLLSYVPMPRAEFARSKSDM